MSTELRFPPLAASALLAAAFGVAACGGGHPPPSENAPAPLSAELARAERVVLPQAIELQGGVVADRSAAVSARVMANVTAIHVAAGDRVRRGQTLLEIDPQAARGQVSQAEGALAQARAALSLAERNYERYRALAEENAASELELDAARMQHEQALGAVEQARGALSSASAVAADSRVVAPFAGRVARRLVEVGDLAAPGRPLLELESAGGRRFAFSVPESTVVASGLGLGMTLEVSLDARPELGPLAATVVEMTPGADSSTHSYAVEATLPLGELPSGSAGRVRLVTGDRPVVTVPVAAVLHQGGIDLVVLRDDDGRAASRAVTLGRRFDGDRLEVLSGLAGGETVLVGLAMVPPAGAPVRSPGEAAAPAAETATRAAEEERR